MTIAEWLVDSMIKMKGADIPRGRTDALVMLSDLFAKDKSWVHAHAELELDDLQLRELEYKLKRRLSGMPLAYIRGFAEFYGRKFTVNSKVLIPRPESEAFIEIIKSLDFETPRIADIGAGSGVLGITAALELPDATVHLYDIDHDALAVAFHNARQYELYLEFYESDLLKDLQNFDYDIFLTNLPYVPDGLITSREIEKEPAGALFSGKDGLDHYRTFWHQVSKLERKPKYILTESLKDQHIELAKLAAHAGYAPQKAEVLVQLFSRA